MIISIIILNYNGLPNTLECLESLRKADKDSISTRLLVVDNNAEDGSQEALAAFKDIELIKNGRNLGFAGGNNVGIKEALRKKSDAIIILNNDTLVDKSFIKNIARSAKKYPIISPKIYFAKGHEFHKTRYSKQQLGHVIWYAGGKIDWDNVLGIHNGVDQVDKGQFNKRSETEYATGACMLVKSEVFEKVGLFDERYFLYLEDMDLCVRAKRAGFKIAYEPKAIIWHKNASSSGSGSDLQNYYISRNRLLFAFKFAKLRTKIAVLRELFLKSKNPIKRKALADFLTARMGRSSLNFSK